MPSLVTKPLVLQMVLCALDCVIIRQFLTFLFSLFLFYLGNLGNLGREGTKSLTKVDLQWSDRSQPVFVTSLVVL